MVVEVQAHDGLIREVVSQDEWPVAGRDLVQAGKRLNGRRDAPDRPEVPRDLALECGSHLHD